jgi:hypothetical protein
MCLKADVVYLALPYTHAVVEHNATAFVCSLSLLPFAVYATMSH